MDIDRNLSPPANEKIVPDVYNVLDAHVQRRMTTFNNMLRYRLDSQEKVISKHRRDAERYIVNEKARTVHSLHKINRKLNAVSRIKDFDLKFFNQRTLDCDTLRTKKQKGYERDKNEDAICHRCYIHHLPLKKKFYRTDEDTLFHKHDPRNFLLSKTESAQDKSNAPEVTGDERQSNRQSPEPEMKESSRLRFRRLSSPKGGSLATTMGAFGWWMPTPQNQQFLWKDKSGREVDLNEGCTPRLVSNEEWKNVVKNVCSRCSKGQGKQADLNKTF